MSYNDVIYADDIVLVGDIAAHYDVSKATVQGWTRSEGFPPPVKQVRAGAVYDLAKIKAWRKRRADELRRRAEMEEGR